MAAGRGVVTRGGCASQERASLKLRSPVVSEPSAHRGVWLSTEAEKRVASESSEYVNTVAVTASLWF